LWSSYPARDVFILIALTTWSLKAFSQLLFEFMILLLIRIGLRLIRWREPASVSFSPYMVDQHIRLYCGPSSVSMVCGYYQHITTTFFTREAFAPMVVQAIGKASVQREKSSIITSRNRISQHDREYDLVRSNVSMFHRLEG
jgi:hypothetical protein